MAIDNLVKNLFNKSTGTITLVNRELKDKSLPIGTFLGLGTTDHTLTLIGAELLSDFHEKRLLAQVFMESYGSVWGLLLHATATLPTLTGGFYALGKFSGWYYDKSKHFHEQPVNEKTKKILENMPFYAGSAIMLYAVINNAYQLLK